MYINRCDSVSLFKYYGDGVKASLCQFLGHTQMIYHAVPLAGFCGQKPCSPFIMIPTVKEFSFFQRIGIWLQQYAQVPQRLVPINQSMQGDASLMMNEQLLKKKMLLRM